MTIFSYLCCKLQQVLWINYETTMYLINWFIT